MYGSYAGIAVNSPYFDVEDINGPVKYQFTEDSLARLSLGLTKSVRVKFHQTFYTLHDNFFNPDSAKTGSFYAYDKSIIETITQSSEVLGTFEISMSSNSYHYESSVYSISDMMGQIGGIFEIFEVLGKMLIGYYVNKTFYHCTIN